MANYAGDERLIDGVGVGICVINENIPDNILLLKRYDGTWGFPGGKVKYGESIYEAAERELFEESGLFIDEALMPWDAFELVGGFESLYERRDEDPRHFLTMMFRIDVSMLNGALTADGKEILEAKWCKIWQLPSPIFVPTRQALTLLFSGQDRGFMQFNEDMYILREATEKKNAADKKLNRLKVVKKDD